MVKSSSILAVAALLAAPANGFMFAPCNGAFNPAATSAAYKAAYKAVQRFQPSVAETKENIQFKFEADSQEAVKVSTAKVGCTSVLTADFKASGDAAPMWPGFNASGGLSRSFFMPPTVAPDDMTSSWADGILTVTIPKKARDSSPSTQAPEASSASSTAERAPPASSADYLNSLSGKTARKTRPRATGTRAAESKQAESSTQPDFDKLLTEMFGVPSGFADAFRPREPTAEEVAAWEAKRDEWNAQAAKWREEQNAKAEAWRAEQEVKTAAWRTQQAEATEAAKTARTAARRAGLYATIAFDAPSSAYNIKIELPERTSASAVSLAAADDADGGAMTVSVKDGPSRRISLPRGVRGGSPGVVAKFVREGENGEFVARLEVTIPKAQPKNIGIDIA